MRYADDSVQEYFRAWAVAEDFLSILRKDARFRIEKVANGTSAFLMAGEGIAAGRFAERLLKQNIVLPLPQKDANSFWMTVNTTLNRIGGGELAEEFLQASRPY
jgi:hypothetical protein